MRADPPLRVAARQPDCERLAQTKRNPCAHVPQVRDRAAGPRRKRVGEVCVCV